MKDGLQSPRREEGPPGTRGRGFARVTTVLACCLVGHVRGEENVYLTEAPDYEWHAGCFGTACGNLIGYWDRHGFPDFYAGPTAGGVAPLDSYAGRNHEGIRALWASCAGRDGRPEDQPGHEDDYYVRYESTTDDPYVTEGRAEHTPDCIGDFIGLNQKKWKNLGGECDGNIDGYTFVYWDSDGNRRENFSPGPEAGEPAWDMQSGLRTFARYRGYQADTFTQLAELNPEIEAADNGFSFDDLKAEIDAGYPLLVFLQNPGETSRALEGMPRANPDIHGMLIHGYYVDGREQPFAYVRTSWASGEQLRPWNTDGWVGASLPVRGVIGFRPLPRVVDVEHDAGRLTVRWVGPDAELFDAIEDTRRRLHWYVLERADALDPAAFVPLSPPTTDREWTVEECCAGAGFFRVKLVLAPE